MPYRCSVGVAGVRTVDPGFEPGCCESYMVREHASAFPITAGDKLFEPLQPDLVLCLRSPFPASTKRARTAEPHKERTFHSDRQTSSSPSDGARPRGIEQTKC